MAKNETELDYQGYTAVEDLETGQTIAIDPQQAKKMYLLQLETYLDNVRTQMLDKNIFYRLLKMDESINVVLRDFINQRNKIKV